MPTGSGPASGGPTPCEDQLAAAQAQLDAITGEWNALGPEVARLLQRLDEASAMLAKLTNQTPTGERGTLSGEQIERIYSQTVGGQSGAAAAETTERRPSTAMTPSVALAIRASGLKERLSRLEAKT